MGIACLYEGGSLGVFRGIVEEHEFPWAVDDEVQREFLGDTTAERPFAKLGRTAKKDALRLRTYATQELKGSRDPCPTEDMFRRGTPVETQALAVVLADVAIVREDVQELNEPVGSVIRERRLFRGREEIIEVARVLESDGEGESRDTRRDEDALHLEQQRFSAAFGRWRRHDDRLFRRGGEIRRGEEHGVPFRSNRVVPQSDPQPAARHPFFLEVGGSVRSKQKKTRDCKHDRRRR